MGQYYYIVNLDKKEFLNPHKMGAGLKLLEIACSNLPRVLPLLLHQSTSRGGGDGDIDNPIISKFRGRWARDRIMFVGDYDEDYKHINEEIDNGEWNDISFELRYAYGKWMDIPEHQLQKPWGHEEELLEFLKSKGETYSPNSDSLTRGRARPDLIFRL